MHWAGLMVRSWVDLKAAVLGKLSVEYLVQKLVELSADMLELLKVAKLVEQ
jgi:hypothetical protein